MKNINVLTTLFVGIDVSSKANVIFAMDFHQTELLSISVPNNHPGARILCEEILFVLQGSSFTSVVFALESTSIYSIHIANYLSSNEELLAFNPYVYCLNPSMTAQYRKSFVDLDKTDKRDAFVIADFARVGRITGQPWRGSQFLSLQRLTRHRLHLVENLTREKTYMVSNIYLKFSQLSVLDDSQHPFSSNYTASATAVLTEMLSPEELLDKPSDELVAFLCAHSRNRFENPEQVAALLRRAANDSYRLDKCLYEPLTIAIASSFNCISAYQHEVSSINKAIKKGVLGLCSNQYQCLTSIPGIGPVFAAGIISEIGDIKAFRSHNALAKYSGLVWKQKQSGNFTADHTPLSKAGNGYLRYYLIEAANSVRRHIPEYRDFYQKKLDEATTNHHKRALALTARKLIRLIFGLLDNDQLYSANRVDLS